MLSKLFVPELFERFLKTFQANEPMIYRHYSEIFELLSNLMSEFIQKRKKISQNPQENIETDVLKMENYQSKEIVEIGVKATSCGLTTYLQ